jgi:hypothetical protein
MSDLEFDVLDELYFVTHYSALSSATGLPTEKLQPTLIELYRKGWIKVFKSVSEEMSVHSVNLGPEFQNYFYLASKEGLLAHNGH